MTSSAAPVIEPSDHVQSSLLSQFSATVAGSRANLLFFDVQEDEAQPLDTLIQRGGGEIVEGRLADRLDGGSRGGQRVGDRAQVARRERDAARRRRDGLVDVVDALHREAGVLREGPHLGRLADEPADETTVAWALREAVTYSSDGQLLTGSLLDYAIPRAADVPYLQLDRTETPSPRNPLGAKGVGESATVGTPAAIANAVVDALRPLGIDNVVLPITQEQVWRLLSPQL